MSRSKTFFAMITSITALAISGNPQDAAARTIQECNTIYNNCTANCDRYAPNAGSAASCIVNCGTKAQSCHNTASDRPGKAATTFSPGASQGTVRAPRKLDDSLLLQQQKLNRTNTLAPTKLDDTLQQQKLNRTNTLTPTTSSGR